MALAPIESIAQQEAVWSHQCFRDPALWTLAVREQLGRWSQEHSEERHILLRYCEDHPVSRDEVAGATCSLDSGANETSKQLQTSLASLPPEVKPAADRYKDCLLTVLLDAVMRMSVAKVPFPATRACILDWLSSPSLHVPGPVACTVHLVLDRNLTGLEFQANSLKELDAQLMDK